MASQPCSPGMGHSTATVGTCNEVLTTLETSAHRAAQGMCATATPCGSNSNRHASGLTESPALSLGVCKQDPLQGLAWF